MLAKLRLAAPKKNAAFKYQLLSTADIDQAPTLRSFLSFVQFETQHQVTNVILLFRESYSMSIILPLLYSLFLNVVADKRTTNRVGVKSDGPVFNLHQALWVFDFAAVAVHVLTFKCWGYVAMRDGWIIVAFRGTRTKIQLITELIESMSEPKRKLRAGGSVQHYFYVALEAVWKQMNAVVRKLRATYPKYSIMFTGHSLGGALASLASTIFAHRNPVLEDSNGYYLHYGVKDHIRYFEHEVSEYGINGCVDSPDPDGMSRLELIR
ncbi:triacylglycerol lipase [Ancylostoma ceylanicum]|uniref:Triacylglycerol lipase n=1 Tax=Ancylostoma ceylanicum TaxID=53326 RepID=A0A0D6LE88_9BILA|nr:triacylglycerol lipase [Ancylostoma ceylanicum]